MKKIYKSYLGEYADIVLQILNTYHATVMD